MGVWRACGIDRHATEEDFVWNDLYRFVFNGLCHRVLE